MKRLYYLLLVLLSASFITSCANVKDTCERSSDCDTDYKCYAGWCADKVPLGHQYFDVQMKDANNNTIKCDDNQVSFVRVYVYRDDFLLPDKDEHNYSYQFTLDCKDVITKMEGDNKKYFYIGGVSSGNLGEHQLNAGKGALVFNKDYRVKFEFLKWNKDILTSEEITINADISGPTDNDDREHVDSVITVIDNNAI